MRFCSVVDERAALDRGAAHATTGSIVVHGAASIRLVAFEPRIADGGAGLAAITLRVQRASTMFCNIVDKQDVIDDGVAEMPRTGTITIDASAGYLISATVGSHLGRQTILNGQPINNGVGRNASCRCAIDVKHGTHCVAIQLGQ
ncbi:hypothetical protein SDC9_61764 [bioreactor metagenome]|uniref:Uncharacterized protein n=1 Tax=bioreactor metagenome TaxID=1076179 RepID=A0A644XMV1_9ZZZZ